VDTALGFIIVKSRYTSSLSIKSNRVWSTFTWRM